MFGAPCVSLRLTCSYLLRASIPGECLFPTSFLKATDSANLEMTKRYALLAPTPRPTLPGKQGHPAGWTGHGEVPQGVRTKMAHVLLTKQTGMFAETRAGNRFLQSTGMRDRYQKSTSGHSRYLECWGLLGFSVFSSLCTRGCAASFSQQPPCGRPQKMKRPTPHPPGPTSHLEPLLTPVVLQGQQDSPSVYSIK